MSDLSKNNSIFIGYNGGNYHPNKKGLESKIYRCRECSLFYPNLLPIPENIQNIYKNPNEYFSFYASQNWEKRIKEHKKTLQKLFNIKKIN